MTKREIPDNVIVRLIDLPPGIGGAIMEDEDGIYNVYINARHGHYAQLDDLDHELAHIEHDDLHNNDPIEFIESRADAHATPRHRLPRLFKASDLLQQTPPVAAASTPPRSQTNPPAPQLSPRQAAVLLRAINDLDDWLFRDTSYDI